MATLYPLPPFRPYIKYEQLSDGTDSFRIGASSDGRFYIDEYYSGNWENTFSAKKP